MTGIYLDFKKNCKAVFSSYVKAQNNPIVINNITPRTHACIYLGPTGNIQVTPKYSCLNTGKLLKQKISSPLWRKIEQPRK